MPNDNETFADSMAKLKATLDCPTETKLPVKGEWCGLCREICDADGTNYCDRNFYLAKVLAVETAHNREIAAKDAEIESLKDENTRLRALVKELSKIVDGPLCHQDCALCPPDTRCASKRLRALVAKAREVCNV